MADDSPDIEDRALLVSLQAGDKSAFHILYERYAAFLERFIRDRDPTIDREDISDLMHSAFQKVRDIQPTDSIRSRLARFVMDRMLAELVARDNFPEQLQKIITDNIQTKELSGSELKLLLLLQEKRPVEQIVEEAAVSRDELSKVIELFGTKLTKTKFTDAQLGYSVVEHPDELEVFIDPGDASPELIAELYTALSALYRSCGGSGLEIVKEERRSFAAEVL